ncbi:S41 family peptidase [Candidatus Parcubacteria bacterium]|nr:MAG: S41 family peptidase [Candidatus Parcubacteria bacterium]
MSRKITLTFFQVVALILISSILGYFYGTNNIGLQWKNYKPIAIIDSKNPPDGGRLDMSLFYDVLDKVNSKYYDKGKIDPQKLTYGAISGMLGSLEDPYTSFFPPKENTSFKTQLAGEFSGIGAELGMSNDNRVTVVSPLDNSPAYKAGIRAGDIIVKVDGKDTSGWTLAQAVENIRGPKGSKVNLGILHEKQKDSVDVSIVRDVIVVKSVTGWVKNVKCNEDKCERVDEGSVLGSKVKDQNASVAYIRLSQFGDKTNNEWVLLISSLSQDIKKQTNFKGIILDVRNNPGGYLKDAVFIASEFLKNGNVVIQENSSGDRYEMSVVRRGVFTDYPLVVLVNRGSASASEIVAGALRDHRKIKLVGEKTFGKGTIQEATDVDSGASVHISVAKWLTPNGIWVDKKGLEPDVKVEFDGDSFKKDPLGFDNQVQKAMMELLK